MQRPGFVFGTEPDQYAREPAPSMEEWRELWASWEAVTLGMIPKGQLLSKPIDLRNPCIFYLGHIPTFLDSVVVRAMHCQPTEPRHYLDIFQRGIDPDVDDPTQCHQHSALPDSWPELDEILDYQKRVRERLESLYCHGTASRQPPDVQRAIWTAFEHEAMHLETLLYMLLQADTTLPPPNVIFPDFVSGKTSERQKEAPEGGPWVKVPAMTLGVGLDDPEDPEDPTPHFFGWDNEKPVRSGVVVPEFAVRTHPITNEEYACYLEAQSSTKIPASWTFAESHGSSGSSGNGAASFTDRICIRTVFGPVPLNLALDWPAIASYDELAGCAEWMHYKIPTADQVRAVYRYSNDMAMATIEKKQSKKIDAVNGFSPPHLPASRWNA